MPDLVREQDDLFTRVAEIIEAARGHVARTVNTAMVHAYWLIGREIVEVEQQGKERAAYGEQLIEGLSRRLKASYGSGYSVRSLRRIRQFYLIYPQGSGLPAEGRPDAIQPTVLAGSGSGEKRPTVLAESGVPSFPPDLSWSHYLALLRVENPQARAFYEIEAVREGWSVRQLERQIAALLFERLAKSRDKDEVMALARAGQTVARPTDVVKDPFVLEFLGLEERAAWHERDLEQAIIDRLEAFLLELGKGFCFIARQKRITLEGDHYYVDLVFYNRLLRCFVLIDLKLGKLTHQDVGQMQMYVNHYDRRQREEHEQPTVGIVLCSDKNDAMVRITLPENNRQILASRYQLYLPTEEELKAELERERVEAERMLGSADADS
jgi:predicted nuclease of restriction endonuclease-like (RecB) superfamily